MSTAAETVGRPRSVDVRSALRTLRPVREVKHRWWRKLERHFVAAASRTQQQPGLQFVRRDQARANFHSLLRTEQGRCDWHHRDILESTVGIERHMPKDALSPPKHPRALNKKPTRRKLLDRDHLPDDRFSSCARAICAANRTERTSSPRLQQNSFCRRVIPCPRIDVSSNRWLALYRSIILSHLHSVA